MGARVRGKKPGSWFRAEEGERPPRRRRKEASPVRGGGLRMRVEGEGLSGRRVPAGEERVGSRLGGVWVGGVRRGGRARGD